VNTSFVKAVEPVTV